MLNGVRIYASDTIWRQILTDFGATVLDAPNPTDINFDNLNVSGPLTPMELKSLILNANDNATVLRDVFGADVSLPRLQVQIIVALHKSGGMTGNELKATLGYAPDVATHTIDTAIYQLRRTYGRGFIVNTNGVYRIGKL
ncbi:MAG: hypothetical protein IJE82_03245 [Alphaproteobacteria bacterium]|nr:hypothetical protein [Alphaproteobacteria bacterium]